MSTPAETYEQFMVPAIFTSLAAALVDSAAPARGARVLDLACGTGIVARTVMAVLDGDCTISGLDPQPAMLDVARNVTSDMKADITWVQGRAEQMPFPDRAFDAVLCQQGLQFVEDRQAAVAEMHRVLVSGGIAGIAVMQAIELHPFYAALATTVEHHLGVPVLHQPFTLSDTAELQSLFSNAGFTNLELLPVTIPARFPNPQRFLDSQIEIASVAIRSGWGLDEQRRSQLVAEIHADMALPLQNHTDDGQLLIPWHVYLARATRP